MNIITVSTETMKCCGRVEKFCPNNANCTVYFYEYSVKVKCWFWSLMRHAERHCRKKKKKKYKQKQGELQTVTHESSVDAPGTQKHKVHVTVVKKG